MIAIDGLVKKFGKRMVLDHLALSIGANDRIAVIGSNGAGKTTLFRCLLGHYRFDGIIAGEQGKARRRDVNLLKRIAFVPQLPPPLRMPVGELLHFAAAASGAATARMNEIAARLGIDLESVRHQPFYRLSGGQKQKVLVTIALARPAELLVFDEPSANLDPAARAAFIDLLAGMKDRAMLIASHRLEEVAPLVNRVIEMEQGRIVLDDAVADRLVGGELRFCRITLSERHDAFERAMKPLRFAISADGLFYEGTIPAAESFRFLGLLSRYASLIDSFTFTALAPVGKELH
jgi:ABC-2 type transport system ATP-binding protein